MLAKGCFKRFPSGRLFLIFVVLLFPAIRSFSEQKAPPEKYRDDSIDILHYNINLTIPNLTAKTLTGITDLQVYTTRDSVRNILLMLDHLTVDSVWINEERDHHVFRKGNIIHIRLQEPQDKGSTVLVTVFYHGRPIHDPHWGGFYFTRRAAFNMGVGMTVTPHPFGRSWFPCIDNFTDKATYDYFITVPDTLVAACPGSLEEVIHNHDGTVTWHWNLSDPVSSYLSSVAVSSYTILRDSLQGMQGLIPAYYFVPKGKAASAKGTFSHVSDYLRIYESLFGPYPWEKIGYATVPFNKGAMEHATCISVPEYILTGTHDFDELLAHEFSHSWFGNLVTCQTARDMWLNEGWATYCEALYREFSRGRAGYTRYIHTNHRRVLQFAYIADKGYYPVFGIPDNLTYGTTVYKKGADIIHTLRNFLGDKVFFDAMKKYFRQFAFMNITTAEFETFLSQTTHQNMEDFFNTWIYTPGFPHFSLDSFIIIRDRDDYVTGLFLKQRLRGRTDYSYNTPVKVTLLDKTWKQHNEKVIISGPSMKKTLITSFRPVAVMLNMNQFVSDATSSDYKIIKQTGAYTFNNCFFRLDVKTLNDSAFVRVIHHWTGPDLPAPPPGFILSENRYWSIEGVLPDSVAWKGSFVYNFSRSMRNGYLDTLPAPSSKEMLKLLYRPSLHTSWREIPVKVTGNPTSGMLLTPFIKEGDYCVAIKRSGSS